MGRPSGSLKSVPCVMLRDWLIPSNENALDTTPETMVELLEIFMVLPKEVRSGVVPPLSTSSGQYAIRPARMSVAQAPPGLKANKRAASKAGQKLEISLFMIIRLSSGCEVIS